MSAVSFDGSYFILYRYACCHCQKWFIFQTLHFNFSVVSVPEWKCQPHVFMASRKHIWQQCQRKGGHLLLAMLGAIDAFPEHHRQQSLWQVLSLSDFTLDMCISYYKRRGSNRFLKQIKHWAASNLTPFQDQSSNTVQVTSSPVQGLVAAHIYC